MIKPNPSAPINWQRTQTASPSDAEVKMHGGRHLAPLAVLFEKAIAYQCSKCGRNFSVALLCGAVQADLPAPPPVRDAFLRHVCERNRAQQRSR